MISDPPYEQLPRHYGDHHHAKADEDKWGPQMMKPIAIDETALTVIYLECRLSLWAARRLSHGHC
jgi:hypothetical protein